MKQSSGMYQNNQKEAIYLEEVFEEFLEKLLMEYLIKALEKIPMKSLEEFLKKPGEVTYRKTCS